MIKEYNIKELQPGMITAIPVRTKRGQLVVNEKVALTGALIARLEFYGIERVRIAEEDDETTFGGEEELEPGYIPAKTPAPIKSPVLDASYSQQVKKSSEFQKFQVDFTLRCNDIKECFESFLVSGNVDRKKLLEDTVSLIGPEQTTIDIFDMLHNMRQVNDSIFAHSINVALISRMIGKWLHFSKEDLDTLTLAGILHDVGKAKIPEEILNKDTKLSDEEFQLIRKHPKLGYDILKNLAVDSHVKKAALMHHERCDGSGYPMGLTLDEIDDYALIIAIADVYDAMTAARSYRAPLCPFEVIAEFEKDGLQKYKPEYILTFLRKIAMTYQNNRIMLSDGTTAKIVLLNSNHLSKPLVQLDDGSCLDLDKSQPYIKSVI